MYVYINIQLNSRMASSLTTTPAFASATLVETAPRPPLIKVSSDSKEPNLTAAEIEANCLALPKSERYHYLYDVLPSPFSGSLCKLPDNLKKLCRKVGYNTD